MLLVIFLTALPICPSNDKINALPQEAANMAEPPAVFRTRLQTQPPLVFITGISLAPTSTPPLSYSSLFLSYTSPLLDGSQASNATTKGCTSLLVFRPQILCAKKPIPIRVGPIINNCPLYCYACLHAYVYGERDGWESEVGEASFPV